MNLKLYLFLCDISYGVEECWTLPVIAEDGIQAMEKVKAQLDLKSDPNGDEDEFKTFLGQVELCDVYDLQWPNINFPSSNPKRYELMRKSQPEFGTVLHIERNEQLNSSVRIIKFEP